MWDQLVTPEGFEPPTNSTGNCHSIQLNYGANILIFCHSIQLSRRNPYGKLRCQYFNFLPFYPVVPKGSLWETTVPIGKKQSSLRKDTLTIQFKSAKGQ